MSKTTVSIPKWPCDSCPRLLDAANPCIGGAAYIMTAEGFDEWECQKYKQWRENMLNALRTSAIEAMRGVTDIPGVEDRMEKISRTEFIKRISKAKPTCLSKSKIEKIVKDLAKIREKNKLDID